MRIRVIFNNEGELAEAKVLKSADPATDAEAVRVMKNIPRSVSEKLKGDTIAMAFTVPVKFSVAPLKEGMRESGSVVTIREKSSLAPQETEIGSKQEDHSEVYDMVTESPEFPGGPKAMMEYLTTNMRYPQIAKENGIQGRVILQFVVDETGKVTDPKILRGVDPALDLEAIRLVEAMPQWTPGKQDGKAVAVRYTVPVSFKLDSEGEASSQDGVISIKAVVSNELYEHTGILGIGSCKTGSSVSPDSVLFLIDGVPATQETFRALSPDKIASISVLKEEKAQVILDKHGKKGMKGVIMIATKDAAAQSQQ